MAEEAGLVVLELPAGHRAAAVTDLCRGLVVVTVVLVIKVVEGGPVLALIVLRRLFLMVAPDLEDALTAVVTTSLALWDPALAEHEVVGLMIRRGEAESTEVEATAVKVKEEGSCLLGPAILAPAVSDLLLTFPPQLLLTLPGVLLTTEAQRAPALIQRVGHCPARLTLSHSVTPWGSCPALRGATPKSDCAIECHSPQTLLPDPPESVLVSCGRIVYPQPGVQNESRFVRTGGQSPYRQQKLKIPQCSATCKDGGPCHHKAKPGQSVCGKHTSQAKPVFVILCGKRLTDGTKCKCPRGVGLKLCKRHHNVNVRRARKQQLDAIWEEALTFLWDLVGHGPEPFMNRLNALLEIANATPKELDHWNQRALNEIDYYRLFYPAADELPPPKSDLEALARDEQNVHTGAVNKQTEEGVTALLETAVAVGQDTLTEIKAAWASRHRDVRKSILKDMRRWYKRSLCRNEGDYLYQRLLDGLWTRIKLSPHREDLVQRLWEEADESRSMCCEGHISRLCNVLVGYDASFKAPVSVGEMLQQRIAAIAGEDISIPHKVVKAWEVMEELQIPREQRMEWIEAF